MEIIISNGSLFQKSFPKSFKQPKNIKEFIIRAKDFHKKIFPTQEVLERYEEMWQTVFSLSLHKRGKGNHGRQFHMEIEVKI